MGEEYLALIPVDDQLSPNSLPIYKRLLFVFFESFGDILTRKFDEKISNFNITNMSYKNWQSKSIRILLIFFRSTFLFFYEGIKYIFRALNFTNLHKAIFFALHTKYLNISRRFSFFQYISLRPQTNVIVSFINKDFLSFY